MRSRTLLLTGVAALVVALLIQAPAATVYGWLLAAGTELPVRAYGIDGTIARGGARSIVRADQTVLGDVQWSLQPWALLLGRASYRLHSDSAPALLDGRVALGFGGVRVSGLKASADLRALAAAIGQPFVPVSARLGLQADELRVVDGWPRQAQGVVQLLDVAWALAREPVPFGDFEAQVRTEGGEIVAAVSTIRGVVDAEGGVRLMPDRSYQVDLLLRPRPDAPPMVANLLRQLGNADAQGFHHLRRSAVAPAPAANAARDAPASQGGYLVVE